MCKSSIYSTVESRLFQNVKPWYIKERVLKFYLQFTFFKAMCHKICNPHIFINKPFQYPGIFDSFSAMVNIHYTVHREVKLF